MDPAEALEVAAREGLADAARARAAARALARGPADEAGEVGDVLAAHGLPRDLVERVREAAPTRVDPPERRGSRTATAPPGRFGPARRPAPGARIGPWVVEGPLGRGGVGAVYRARHADTGEPAALKLLHPGLRASGRARARFRREAELARSLDHPALVRVLDAGEADGVDYLAMELVEGRTLAEHLDRLPPPALAANLARVCAGLEVAHRRGLVHRDLKPTNVLVREVDGAPVVTDFGLARDVTAPSDLTRSGVGVGTPKTMAPEQTRGEVASPASDVWAVGWLLYRGLTGREPFPRPSVYELFRAIAEDRPPPPRAVRPEVPAELERICLRCLAKDPAGRYPSAGAVGRELEAFLGGGSAAGRGRRRATLAAALVAAVGLAVAGALVARSGASLPAERPAAPTAAAARTPTAPTPPPARRELVLRPGPLRGVDTTLRQDMLYVNDNHGASPSLLVGDRPTPSGRGGGDLRALLRFDLAAVPAGARVESASLLLSCVGAEFGDGPLRLEARPVAPSGPRTPWREGTTTHDGLLDGVAWDGGVPSRDPRVASGRPDLTQPDVDPTATPGAADVARRYRGVVALDVTAFVRAWVEGGGPNHGLRLSHSPEGPPYRDGVKRFASSDHPDPALRPRLVVRYRGAAPGPDPDPAALEAEAAAAARRLLAGAEVAPASERWPLVQAAVARAPFLGEAFLARARVHLAAGRAIAARLDVRLAAAAAAPARDAGLERAIEAAR